MISYKIIILYGVNYCDKLYIMPFITIAYPMEYANKQDTVIP